jgi:D-mannonate dehydratase
MAKLKSIGKTAKKVISNMKKIGAKGIVSPLTNQKFSTSSSKKNVSRLRQDINTVQKKTTPAGKKAIKSLRKK